MKTQLITMTLIVVTGWAWACGSDSSPTLSVEHCTNNGGDAYCADLLVNRPYCISTGDECPTTDIYGCAAGVVPECHEGLCDEAGAIAPECHAPCGEPGDLSCVEGEDSGSETGTSGSETGSSGSETGSSSGTTGEMPCVGDGDCMDAEAPFCDPVGECVGCDGMSDPDGACAGVDAGMPVCDAGVCVACTGEQVGACEGETPVCGEGNVCTACTEHAQCPESACHLDGAEVGGCFDAADVVMVADAGELAAALGTIGGGQGVLVLADATDFNQTVNIAGDAEVAILGPSSADLSGTSGLPSLNVGGNAIVYLAGPSVANGDADGVSCSGTSVWLDDSEVRNNAQVGLDVSGGCAAHLRRSVVRANAGGGIVADGATSSLSIVNSVVGDNVGGAAGPGIRVISSDIAITYSTLVSNGTFADPNNLECLSGATGRVSNSIISGPNGNSVLTCEDLSWDNNAVDTAGLMGEMPTAGAYDAAWFAMPGVGDFHLTTAGEAVFVDIASWQPGDPLTDIDGDAIPTDGPSFPGYDQP